MKILRALPILVVWLLLVKAAQSIREWPNWPRWLQAISILVILVACITIKGAIQLRREAKKVDDERLP
jgi:hypothetical protein